MPRIRMDHHHDLYIDRVDKYASGIYRNHHQPQSLYNYFPGKEPSLSTLSRTEANHGFQLDGHSD